MKIHSCMFRLLPVVLGLVTVNTASGQPAPPSPHTLAKQAAFIFEGVVEKPRGANFEAATLPPNSLVARVAKVLYVKPAVSVRAGDLVIVQLAKETPVPVQTRAVFYTNGWIYGKHLVVRELGHTAQDTSPDQLQKEIASAKVEAENDRIRERINAAAIVISGRVENVKRYEPKERRPISEHDPDWRIAQVSVKQFFKGEAGNNVVLVAFPNSRDVMWAESPKFTAEQQGIWILARPKNLERFFADVNQPVYTAINARDFRELKDAGRITTLLKNPNTNQ